MWDLAFIFLRPLVSGSHLFELLLEKYRVAFFGEILQEWFQYSALLLVQQRIHVRHQSTRPFWKNFTLSHV